MSVNDDRARLLGIAYRMLGSASEAEDAVQETYARWYELGAGERARIASPTAWLVRVVSRVCLDMLGSARARRERYVGEWLPEPLPDAELDPAERVTLDESLTMALLVVLETMTPAERVAFVLHDVFGYPFAEIAEIVGRSPGACRELASSARRRIAARRPAAGSPADGEIVAAFRSAWDDGDLSRLVGLLDPDVVIVTDGGGRVSAALEPIAGAAAVAAYLLAVRERRPGLAVAIEPVNARPGLVARADGTTLAVIALDVAGGRIRHLWAVRNPDKLGHWPEDHQRGSTPWP